MLTRIIIVSIFVPLASASWWFMPPIHVSAVGGAPSPAMCDLIPGLARVQRRMCQMQPELMTPVGDGVRRGVAECQRQFANYRWNCTSVERSGGASRIMLKPGTSESAFVYAITTAGVVFSIAKSCQKGELGECECDRRWSKGRSQDAQGEFQWGGCSDNIPYASDFARRFIDARDRRSRDARALMNLHNNRAGRKVIRRSLEKRCKCHGVSGSCVMRTCWNSLSKFDVIGDALRRKYDAAVQVTVSPKNAGLSPATGFVSNRQYDQPLSNGQQANFESNRRRKSERIDKLDLVYFEPSPDYCSNDPRTGPGTAGRRCNRTSTGPDSCDSLCCGRGFDTIRQLKTYQCGCRFVYCCNVVCQQCTEWEDVNTCKRSQYA